MTSVTRTPLDKTWPHAVGVLCLDRTTDPYTVALRLSSDSAAAFDVASTPVPGGGALATLGLGSASIAAVSTNSGVYLTTDSGAHWQKTLPCFARWLGFESPTEAHALCGDTVYRSSDSGETWSSYRFS